ncbi:F0F1 ATP synthase subunit B family protein [Streptomyces boluensis]|uniref:ATP synthase subunit b n=1 Tax=Streptomyces boluensis TaxID=1775135 RepID=A0A964XMS2_9ACTN|nr:hypothetical protein [Streptomyces boluensis]NBE52883.1 hypothetical protein [Streptomyces boluensis]
MYLIPEELGLKIGPLNPLVEDLLVGLIAFAAVFALFRLVLVPRIAKVQAERADLMDERLTGDLMFHVEALRAEREQLLAEARHEAARTRQSAVEEGTALIVEARDEGLRERAELLASGQATVESERAAAEAELRTHVADLASELASRIVGEPIVAGPAKTASA